jgi:hypothetical protein
MRASRTISGDVISPFFKMADLMDSRGIMRLDSSQSEFNLKNKEVKILAIQWYSTAAAPAAQQTDYKISKSTIVLSEQGQGKLPDGIAVKLGYDADRNVIAIAPASEGDKTAFKLARRGRGTQQQITAKKLFQRFGIQSVDGIEGNFEETDGVLFASLAGSGSGAPKRRRRTKQEMAAAAEASGE